MIKKTSWLGKILRKCIFCKERECDFTYLEDSWYESIDVCAYHQRCLDAVSGSPDLFSDGQVVVASEILIDIKRTREWEESKKKEAMDVVQNKLIKPTIPKPNMIIE